LVPPHSGTFEAEAALAKDRDIGVPTATPSAKSAATLMRGSLSRVTFASFGKMHRIFVFEMVRLEGVPKTGDLLKFALRLQIPIRKRMEERTMSIRILDEDLLVKFYERHNVFT
jgi:hypothetical protein